MRNVITAIKPLLRKPKADAGYAALILLALTCMMLVTKPAQADVSNCTVTLSPAEHNYGDLIKSRQKFVNTSQGNVTELSERSSNLTITCPQAERLDLRFSGIRITDGSFAFGQQGKVIVRLSSAVLDGNAVQLSKTKQKGIASGPLVADTQPVHADDEITVGGNSSVKGMNLSATLTITPYLRESAFVVKDAHRQEELLNIELLAVN